MSITVAGVRKDTLEYLGNTPVRSASVHDGNFWGYDCWAVQFVPGQPMTVGWIFTPGDPAQPWLGGVFAPQTITYPAIEIQREQCAAQVKSVAANKQAQLAGDSQDAAGLMKRKEELESLPSRTPEQEAEWLQLVSAWGISKEITDRYNELLAWIAVETNQSTLAAFDGMNPPDGLGWPA